MTVAAPLPSEPLSPLMPAEGKIGRAFNIVMAVLSFLAAICLLSSNIAYRAADNWQADIGRTATVQILPSVEEGAPAQDAMAAQAQAFLRREYAASVEIVPREETRALLRPWLGTAQLPKDLPMPILLNVEFPKPLLAYGDDNNVAAALSSAGIEAIFDNHSAWRGRLGQTIGVIQLLSMFLLGLLMLSIIAATLFATRGAIDRYARLMANLEHVGATPGFIGKIFAKRFAFGALKTSLIGVVIALAVLAIVRLLLPENSMPPSGGSQMGVWLPVLLVPISFPIFAGATAWYSSRQYLYKGFFS